MIKRERQEKIQENKGRVRDVMKFKVCKEGKKETDTGRTKRLLDK